MTKWTIRDIAEMAGVSPGTVSKVINQTGSLSPKTIEKVKKVIDETGYVPSFSAKALATKKSNLIGLIYAGEVHVEFAHPFFNSVINSFKNTIGQLGYDLLMFSNPSFNNGIEDYVARCKHYQLDGCLIVTGERVEGAIYDLDQSDIPTVGIDLKLTGKQSSYITTDNAKISNLVVRYFHELGLKKLAFIGGQEESLITATRKEAFLQSLKLSKMETSSEWIRFGDYFEESGYEQMKHILDSDSLPEAVFAVSDMMALGAIEAIKERGLRVPEDIRVIGCDDIDACRYSEPALATVKQDQLEIGERAAEILHDLINGEKVEPCYLVDPEIVIRKSAR
ncbi:LacI family transcriptional regulator [Gracilibacillus halotolerans]|uniref:LacI family transcriptional regulator n=1 Tax=Gracilibacillus halotolerans TaxID=74386 RepID=A0A841RE36_9BACI|nr:LacI family DNA-binding transcriptional regulator [Gracilibacillus halotolerans]MBB6512260.1 LacI family transcriptional regulator [Gracilibacillus halotolerans]